MLNNQIGVTQIGEEFDEEEIVSDPYPILLMGSGKLGITVDELLKKINAETLEKKDLKLTEYATPRKGMMERINAENEKRSRDISTGILREEEERDREPIELSISRLERMLADW